MVLNNPYQTYQENTVTTASPGELTLMLYNGCLKFVKQGKKAIEENNIEEKNLYLLKSQNIISELMATLNMDFEVSHQMIQIYDYIYYRLVDANIKNDIAMLDEVEVLVTEFRDTWKEVIQINRKKQFGTGQ